MSEVLFQRAREIIDSTADRYRMKHTVLAAESAYEEKESGLVIGHSKALVEGICKSMLSEYQTEYLDHLTLAKLAKKTMGIFEVAKGVEKEQKTAQAFKKIVGSSAAHFVATIDGLGTLRNEFCPLAHGRDLNHVTLDLHYAYFIAKQADSITGFIYDLRESYISTEPNSKPTKDAEFDDFLDYEFNSVAIYENIYLPSEILFNVSPDDYQKTLEEHKESLQEEAQ